MKIWRKFNDSTVTEVSEEEVFKAANGSKSTKESAYWVVYLNQQIADMLSNNKCFGYEVLKPTSVNLYASYIPEALKVEITHSNKKFEFKQDNELI